jgi:hypothetical protein
MTDCQKGVVMKYLLSLMMFFYSFVSISAAELPEYLQELKEDYESKMKVWAIEDDDFEDDDDKEWFVLKFCSTQDDTNKSIKLNYLMRVTVQLTDKKTDTVVFAQMEREKIKTINHMEYYSGRTEWQFWIPFGEMKKPKLTAYAIEFGFKQDGYFVPVAVDYDGVESAEEILEGGGQNVTMYETLYNIVWYGEKTRYPTHPLTGEEVKP